GPRLPWPSGRARGRPLQRRRRPMSTAPVPATLTAEDGTVFRDLDHDGVMAPFEDPRRSPAERAADLTGRLSLEEKAGLFFHTIIETSPDGEVVEGTGRARSMSTEGMILGQGITHVN